MNEPLIDVIIPVYNGAAFIGEAIASIQAQTCKNVKIIIVDDGSEDDTAGIVTKLAATDDRITLIKQQHLGVQFALNAALEYAKADYTAFLDADDLWHPQKLEKQMQVITIGNFEMCFCLLQEFEDSSLIPEVTKHRARGQAMKGYHKTACLARREVFSKYGVFNEIVGIGDFVEWYSRAIRANAKVEMIDEILAYRRIHTTNTMIKADKNSFLHILKAHLDKVRDSKGE